MNKKPRTTRTLTYETLSSASSQPSILAWGDMREPSARWRLVPVAVSVSDCRSSDPILVGEPLPHNSCHEAVQPLQGMPLHVALIEAERELVNVAVQVLIAGVVVDAVQTALQDRPDAFHAVRRDAIADILAGAVNDGLVLIVAMEAGIA